MLTRSTVTALAAALVLCASPAAFAAKGPAKPRTLKVKPRTGALAPGAHTRVKSRGGNSLRRAQRPAARPTTTTVAARKGTSVRGARLARPTPKPSISKNVGWGTFWATIGVASVLTGGAGAVGGAVIGGSAAAYNFIKAYLNHRTSTTAQQSRDVAFNAGWGAFWTGMGVHGIVMGDPLSAAIGLGAGAYNLIKAGMNYSKLPRD